MTTQRLRDLMEERVADVEADDLSARAWARADGVRRRRRIAAIGTAAAAVLVVAGGVAVLDDRQPTNAPARRAADVDARRPGRPTTTRRARRPSSPASSAARPSGGRRPPSTTPSSPCCRCRASRTCCRWPTRTRSARHRTAWTRCSARGSSSTACSATTGSCRSTCPTGWVRWATRAATCSTRWVPSVSPDGTQVFFRQPGRVEVWDLPTNTWRIVETADYEQAAWTSDGRAVAAGRRRHRPTGPVGPAATSSTRHVVVGPGGARRARLDGDAGAGRRASPAIRQPRVPGGRLGRRPQPARDRASTGGARSAARWWAGSATTSCCSRPRRPTAAYRVLAWRVGTPDLYRVSEYVDVPAAVRGRQLGGGRVHVLRAVSRSRKARSRPSRAWSRSRRVAMTAARNASGGVFAGGGGATYGATCCASVLPTETR